MSQSSPKVALVTGANGITGGALIEHLVRNADSLGFAKIIATSRSPFQSTVSDSKLHFVSLDFAQTPEELTELMRDVCSEVTHAYFSSYVHKDDFQELNNSNRALFENFLEALLSTSSKLQNVTLQTGGKHYGVHRSPVPSPAREDEPRRGSPSDNFYFPQEDFLVTKQNGQKWSWNVVRPEAIIGTTIKPNGMNSALTYALYILTCKKLGHEPVMPTNGIYWNGYDDCSHAPLIADFTMFVSTNPACDNEAFNVTNGDCFCWKYMWPRLTSYFGVESRHDIQFQDTIKPGVPHLDLSLGEWATDEKRRAWEQLCEESGCPEAKTSWDAGTWQYQDWVFGRTWSATLSMSKAKKFGYTGYIDSYQALTETFDKMKALKQIPA